MSQFPTWKYVLLIVVLVLGAIYALPNIYGDDPAVQVSSSRGFDLQSELVGQIENQLDSAGIAYRQVDFSPQRVLVRFDNTDRQMRAADLLRDSFGTDFVV